VNYCFTTAADQEMVVAAEYSVSSVVVELKLPILIQKLGRNMIALFVQVGFLANPPSPLDRESQRPRIQRFHSGNLSCSGRKLAKLKHGINSAGHEFESENICGACGTGDGGQRTADGHLANPTGCQREGSWIAAGQCGR
jgi:hypothetical protein